MSEKTCPTCGGPLVSLMSLNERRCGDCKTIYEWALKPGQKSLLIKGLVGDDKSEKYIQK